MKKRSLLIFVALALVPLILLAQISSPGSYASVIMTFLRSTTAAAARSAIGAGTGSTDLNFDTTQVTTTSSTNFTIKSGATLTNSVIYGSTSGSWTFGSTGNLNSSAAATLGVGTSSPDKALDVNSATGANLQLTYNDSNGSAANKVTFDVSSSGDLTIAPSGADLNLTGSLTATGSIIPGNGLNFGSTANRAQIIYVNGTGSLNCSGFYTFQGSQSTSTGTIFTFSNGSTSSATSGTQRHLLVSSGFAPTSGTAVYNQVEISPTVNQTGGSSGITRGLYINPTITAAADFRGLEVAAGKSVFGAQLASTATSATLAAAATTLAITSNVVTVTGDAGANTIATITGGLSGQLLTLIFADSLVTITDDATGNANTANLSAAFTSTSNDTLTLVFNGTSWREVARSVN